MECTSNIQTIQETRKAFCRSRTIEPLDRARRCLGSQLESLQRLTTLHFLRLLEDLLSGFRSDFQTIVFQIHSPIVLVIEYSINRENQGEQGTNKNESIHEMFSIVRLFDQLVSSIIIGNTPEADVRDHE